MTENQNTKIDSTIQFVKKHLKDAEGGHDWWHIYRVWKTSGKIAKEESADEYVVQLAALLHDIADSKFHNGNEEIGPQTAKDFLVKLEINKEVIDHVVDIIKHMSYKNTFEKATFNSLELDIVRDADRLDAIGAIGIARTFNYGGHIGSELYNPDIKSIKYKSKQEYKNSNSPTINHFYEKLLLLKDMMKTTTGKKLAEDRHRYMQSFLDEFYGEWEGSI